MHTGWYGDEAAQNAKHGCAWSASFDLDSGKPYNNLPSVLLKTKSFGIGD